STNEEICLSRDPESSSKNDGNRMGHLCNKVKNALRIPDLLTDIRSLLSKMV
ncbi:hypothetical protein HHI36_008290, partial [Cryptolaemus montrouzieri]